MFMALKNTDKSILLLFTDASVNPISKIGYGAYLVLDKHKLSKHQTQLEDVKTKRFENTSSSRLELETLLWALSEIDLKNSLITIYTDCQNIIGLKDRKEKLLKQGCLSKKNKVIKNYELYKKFYKTMNQTQLNFIKVKGHKKKSSKDEIDTLFSLVDKASRAALRKNNVDLR